MKRPTERQPLSTPLKVQLFVALHLAAAVLIYAAALWIGSSATQAPMPSEASRPSVGTGSTPASSSIGRTTPEPTLASPAPSLATTPSEPGIATVALDTPAPWTIDRQGHVRWRTP